MQEIRDVGSISGSGRSPGRGNGNPLQHSWRIPQTEQPGGLLHVVVKELDMTEVTYTYVI